MFALRSRDGGSSPQTKINRLLGSLCKVCLVPCSSFGFVPSTRQASELPDCLGLLPEEGTCPEVSQDGGREAPLSPCPGYWAALAGRVSAVQPVVHRNYLFKRFLLFWPGVWELCSEAVPFVEQLKFDALFFVVLYYVERLLVSFLRCLALFPLC